MTKPPQDLFVHNTLSKKLEIFVPLNKNLVTLYNCGPTIHALHTSIGNLRSYIFSDFVKRYLIFLGFNVRHVIKVTDVDDHTIKESRQAGKTLDTYTEIYYRDFINQLSLVNVIPPDFLPRVTDNIEDIIQAIQQLIDSGFTYRSNNSTYFRINSLSEYGKLVNFEKQQALKKNAQGRMEDFLSEEKENINDFCLWKGYNPDSDNVYWDTSFGKGRPGWHIECSVISRKYLGNSIDIHIGGISHIFPHHENEIALSEAITHVPFVKYWLHHDYLVVDGKKMSKAGSTYLTLSDIEKRGYNPMILRYTLLKTHYRQKLDFSWNSMEESKKILAKIVETMLWLENVSNGNKNSLNMEKEILICKTIFQNGLNQDFNISLALSGIFAFIRTLMSVKDTINNTQANMAYNFLLEIDEVLGCIKPLLNDYKHRIGELLKTNDFKNLLAKWKEYKNSKDYKSADEIRSAFLRNGIKIIDMGKDSYYLTPA